MHKKLLVFILSSTMVAFLLIGHSFAAPSTWTQTTDVDFNAGTKRNTLVTGTGTAGSVVLSSGAFVYRREITIDNSAGDTLTDYQVRIVLNGANFDFSKTQSNGEDIRFLDSDDSSLLSFWIDSWDGVAQSAVVWVKVPSVPAFLNSSAKAAFGSSASRGLAFPISLPGQSP